jgi:mortality factor 4-like protein 1
MFTCKVRLELRVARGACLFTTTTMSTGTLPFAPNERVLCYHGPLIYEAKVLKAEAWDDSNTKVAGAVGPHFFVHYKGWKQT